MSNCCLVDQNVISCPSSLVERDPKKRRVKPVEGLIGALDLEDSEDDSDYNPTNAADDDEDDIDDEFSDENDKDVDNDDDDSEEDLALQQSTSKSKIKSSPKNRKSPIKSNDLSAIVSQRIPHSAYSSAPILVCSVCLGDISRSDDEIVVCDSCGISVHEGCYGIVSDDTESIHSNTSSASTEPWFCDPCKANLRDPVSIDTNYIKDN